MRTQRVVVWQERWCALCVLDDRNKSRTDHLLCRRWMAAPADDLQFVASPSMAAPPKNPPRRSCIAGRRQRVESRQRQLGCCAAAQAWAGSLSATRSGSQPNGIIVIRAVVPFRNLRDDPIRDLRQSILSSIRLPMAALRKILDTRHKKHLL